VTSAIARGMKGVSAREAPAPLTALKAADVIRGNPFKGHQRIPTGIPSMDKNTRGGLPVGAVVTFQGKPGTGKTALAIQVAAKAVREMNAVAIGLFPDEGRMRAAVRLGQNLGFDRALLEDGDEAELARFDAALETMDFWFPDPDDQSAFVENVAQLFKQERFAGRPLVFVVDSTQTARTKGLADDATQTIRVAAVMEALRRLALITPCLILNISQVNRGAYRNKKDEDNIDPLAGGADSRAVEFVSDLLVHMSGDTDKVVSIQTPKSRLGEKFRCRLGFAKLSATLQEIDPEAEAEEVDASFQKQVANAKAAILKQLRAHPSGLQAGPLRELSAGKKSTHLIARNQLLDDSKIYAETDSRYPVFRLAPGLE
jgi:KaiC/GvpD/RAD55 family RecA-like ATPase